MNKRKVIGWIAIISVFVIGGFLANNNDVEKKREIDIGEYIYTKPWRNGTKNEFIQISKILAKNRVGGCGEYYLKSTKKDGEYVVACSDDGRHWSYYVIYTDTDEVYPAHGKLGQELFFNPPLKP